MKAIVAVDNKWAIGNKGDLLEYIPDDMKRFKQFTIGKIVVMGRKTYESLPNGKPLPHRINIILSHNTNFKVSEDNVIVCYSLSELLDKLKQFHSNDIFVIGGSAIYSLLLPLCDTVYLTHINKSYEADSYFPNLRLLGNWKIANHSGLFTSPKGTEFSFVWYNNTIINP